MDTSNKLPLGILMLLGGVFGGIVAFAHGYILLGLVLLAVAIIGGFIIENI